MARNTLRLDTSGFTPLLRRLDDIGGDVQKAVTESLAKAGDIITKDTKAAMAKENLPAKGKYSTGATLKTIVENAQVEWEGLVGSIPVGFDFSLPGAGGYLITGTPKMKPNKALHKIYKEKKYMSDLQSVICETILSHIVQEMEKA